MSEQLPSPEFDRRKYERPNDKWICGRAADGECCPLGPDAQGRCRATFECRPALEKKEGEETGRYRCTRAKEHGGPCEHGPLPDGTCCRAIPKCSPVRSLRNKRGVFTLLFISLTVGALLVLLYGPHRLEFISPGELSKQHSFIEQKRSLDAVNQGACIHCHSAALKRPQGWLQSAFFASPNPLEPQKLWDIKKTAMTRIDENCQGCHNHQTFHQPNVVRDHSCSACHREHLGGGRMKQPDDANCISCHGDAPIMQASLEMGKTLSPHKFDYRADLGRVLFKAPRPERGYTAVFQSFAKDHPEFQFRREQLKDGDTLKFNHVRHFETDVPTLNGKKLDCVFCHKPDAAGIYHQKITYEANCKICHALQFDLENPDLTLPHGNVAAVRAFLRSLPQQYADFARRSRGLTNNGDVEKFVSAQMLRQRQQALSGENLENAVFFSAEKWSPSAEIGHTGTEGPARFPGCARCHEVTPAGENVPVVTKPVIPDRWLLRGNFNHSKHTNVDCETCHWVFQSRQTADINLPEKIICTSCHNPTTGVSSSCATCHSYHVKGEWMTTAR